MSAVKVLPNKGKLEKTLEQVKGANAELETFGVTLSAKDRRRMSRPRKRFQPLVDQVITIAKKHGVTVPGVSLDDLAATQQTCAALAPFVQAYKAGVQLAVDTLNAATNDSWNGFLAFYTSFVAIAKHNPAFAAEIAPLVEAMSTSRKKRPQPPKEGASETTLPSNGAPTH